MEAARICFWAFYCYCLRVGNILGRSSFSSGKDSLNSAWLLSWGTLVEIANPGCRSAKSWPRVNSGRLQLSFRRSGLLQIILVLFVIMFAGSVGAGGKEVIRLGEINPLTGHLAQHGQEIHQGVVYAVEEVNAQGGIQGRPVKLCSRDDQSRPEIALNQAQELIFREKIAGLVGGYVDSLVAPVSELAARYQVPYVASASLQQALTRQRRNPYFFRVSRLDGIVEPLSRFIDEKLKARRVAILHIATPGSTEFAASLRDNLSKVGIAVPLLEKCRAGSRDFSTFLLKVKQAGVDILVSGGFYPDNLILVRQWREMRLPLKALVAPWGVAYQSFISTLGRASEGLLGMCAWNPGITWPGTEAASCRFVQGFRQRFGQEPNTTTMHGYTSARALLLALAQLASRAEPLTGPALSQALRKLEVVLPMEHLKFDEYGDPLYYRQVVVQIQQGRMVVVYPPERAKGWLPTAPSLAE